MNSKDRLPLQWLIKSGLKKANFWQTLVDGKVECRLCPRNCIINPGDCGFCKTRFNVRGILKTAIWGKLLTPTVEPIENEAVFHYWPGAKILSLGNLGCNLDCSFCQNWESSHMLTVDKKYVRYKTPRELVDLAKALEIGVISFTYNDPAIWFEFIYETSQLAHEQGLKTLFKSAGFMSAQVARKLTEVIDIFSISLKSIDPKTFKKMSKGILKPILKALEIFHNSQSHLEISNLVVTDLNDAEDQVQLLARWVKEKLADSVPLHFVRFHPSYKYTHVQRTSITFLERARALALSEGLKYVYIGNTYHQGHADLLCNTCKSLLIKRFGLYTTVVGVTQEGICRFCGSATGIVMKPDNQKTDAATTILGKKCFAWNWSNIDSRNIHLHVYNTSPHLVTLIGEHIGKNGETMDCEVVNIPGDTEIRMAFGQSNQEEGKILLHYSDSLQCSMAELEDRAHFPLEKIWPLNPKIQNQPGSQKHHSPGKIL